MREIKFRGRNIKDEWCFGLLSRANSCWFISNSAGAPFAFQVCEATIGQFTGLQDKNGKDIYEGDVIRYNDGQKKVNGEFVENYSIFAVEYRKCAFNIAMFTEVTSSIEVIGNIHDNPELIAGQI